MALIDSTGEGWVAGQGWGGVGCACTRGKSGGGEGGWRWTLLPCPRFSTSDQTEVHRERPLTASAVFGKACFPARSYRIGQDTLLMLITARTLRMCLPCHSARLDTTPAMMLCVNHSPSLPRYTLPVFELVSPASASCR